MVDIEVTVDMKVGRDKLSENIINLRWYSIEDYHIFVVWVIESLDECGIIDKCHAKVHIGQIGFLVFFAALPQGNSSLI